MGKRLSLLNYVTFNEIGNSIFTISGYLTLAKSQDGEPVQEYLESLGKSIRKVEKSLAFAKEYQQLGTNIPTWQDVQRSFLLGISHLNFSSIHRKVQLDNLEIYTSSLIERVFFALAKNVLTHAKDATDVTINYEIVKDGLLLFFRDNGPGISDTNKDKIFEQGYGSQKGMDLFLVREILSITGITIRETGTYGEGTCIEIFVPNGAYRFADNQ
jgi:signal transduction histidine kinase